MFGLQNTTVIGALLYMGCSTDLHNLAYAAYLKVFLNWGTDPDLQDRDGRTALHLHQDNLGSVKILIESHANVNLQDNSGDTPLHVSARKGRTAVAVILMNTGASTSKVNNENQTALDTAAVHGNLECFRKMFDHATESERCEWDEDQIGSKEWNEACQGLTSKWGQVKHEKIEELSHVQ